MHIYRYIERERERKSKRYATKTTEPLSFSDIMKQHWEECCIPCTPTTKILCYKNNQTPIVF